MKEYCLVCKSSLIHYADEDILADIICLNCGFQYGLDDSCFSELNVYRWRKTWSNYNLPISEMKPFETRKYYDLQSDYQIIHNRLPSVDSVRNCFNPHVDLRMKKIDWDVLRWLWTKDWISEEEIIKYCDYRLGEEVDETKIELLVDIAYFSKGEKEVLNKKISLLSKMDQYSSPVELRAAKVIYNQICKKDDFIERTSDFIDLIVYFGLQELYDYLYFNLINKDSEILRICDELEVKCKKFFYLE